jgi:CheY-like chemotaxis protein
LVAKILVADDNSNIQKMVVLALKDQGIDVVAVGNGEAAVRKIADVRPDLVLADVFMPVRNGYEVCQFVKMDPSLAHIPVILLVGAFDPLDEQEAQRVGADGVLKKPFVPPDPLISMVKSALLRAGVAAGNAAGAKTHEPEPMRAADLLGPSSASLPTTSAVPVQSVSHDEPFAVPNDESFVDEAPAQLEPVRIDSGAQPLAFGSLLETPGEPTEEDISFLPPGNAELVPQRDWRDPDVEESDEEEEEEEKPETPWRREDAESYADAGSKPVGGAKDWRTGGFEQIAAEKTRGGAWEPEEEKPELVETAPAASNRLPQAPAAPVIVPEATTQVPVSPFAADAWAPPVSTRPEEKSPSKTVTAVEEVAHTPSQEQVSAKTVVASTPEVVETKPEKKEGKDSWFSVPANPWDAEIEKANRLASAWDAPVTSGSSNGTEKAAEAAEAVVSEETQKVIEEAALPAAAVEAIREEAAQVAEGATHGMEQLNADGTSFYAPVPPDALVETPTAAPAAAPNMDDLVARVLARMSPEVLQAVTREILKPVVEAMVKEEMKLKK